LAYVTAPYRKPAVLNTFYFKISFNIVTFYKPVRYFWLLFRFCD